MKGSVMPKLDVSHRRLPLARLASGLTTSLALGALVAFAAPRPGPDWSGRSS